MHESHERPTKCQMAAYISRKLGVTITPSEINSMRRELLAKIYHGLMDYMDGR